MKTGAVEHKTLEPGEYPATVKELYIGLKDYEDKDSGLMQWYPSLQFVYELSTGDERFEYITLYFEDDGNLRISKNSKLYARLKALFGAYKIEDVTLESDAEGLPDLLKFPEESHEAVLRVKNKSVIGRKLMVILDTVTTRKGNKVTVVTDTAPAIND